MPDSHPPAITFGGESIAFPVIRNLARAGAQAHAVGGAPEHNPIRYSRYCAAYTDLGSGEGVQERWLDWLMSDGPRGAVLLPCNDEGLEMILKNRALLEERGYVCIEADDEVLRAMLDKELTYELARPAGIVCPHTAALRSMADLDAAAAELSYPCALKPLRTNLFAREFGIGNKLLVAADEGELRDGLARMLALGLEMMVTEIVPGSDEQLVSYCGYLDEHGEPLTHFTFRKLRQFPPHFGLGCYVVSDWNEEVIEEGLRFLRGVGLRGLFHVEFKRDADDGRLKLLECNHRFTIEAMFAPRDLALLTYNRLLGRPLPPERRYRAGLHLWNPIEDARSLRSYRRAGEWTRRRWLASLAHRQRFHAFRWDDPMPTIVYHLRWLWRVLRRRLGRGRKSAYLAAREPLLPR
jgi:D-aspartate ligase